MSANEISLCSIQPHIRFFHLATRFRDFLYPVSVAYDCRLFYITDGTGEFTVNGKKYELLAGSLIIIKHGCCYSCETDNSSDFSFLMFNFDFTQNCCDIPPFSPVAPESFDENALLAPVKFTDTAVYDSVLYLRNAQRFYTTLLAIYDELNTNRFGSSRIADFRFGAFLIELARSVQFSDPANENRAQRIVKYIHENLSLKLSDELLGNALHYHPNHIRKMVTEYTGLPTHKFILECRLARALELLIETDLPLKHICESSGFNDFTHFTKTFKKKYGRNPSSYR